jgi:hypothetical protein
VLGFIKKTLKKKEYLFPARKIKNNKKPNKQTNKQTNKQKRLFYVTSQSKILLAFGELASWRVVIRTLGLDQSGSF